MPRSESVQHPAAAPAPFHHPHFETPRQRQARLFRREIREFLRTAEAQRARLSRVRILESVQ
ncbi:hypothetical protein [Aquibium microcysteis]|uniref:hypothetical protein n=1 Tax=Aquibium microcysteis TaxID=675281 RepID=UPI00165D0F21|nr:hypothetical protein [Aquibium microcysteis]